ncbi:hypothetical protein [Listeria ilorinensis]|uniref:hypothetical protein n=1 Tax=Listeria ilorinensis TaxID=2867439 RepID=UPI001EF45CE7|nr:hypothetical protein [Listeria ilorinensis]
MEDGKTRESQKKAVKAYRDRNPEQARYNSYKSSAKTFIRNHATVKDLAELDELIKARKHLIEGE